MKASDYRNKYNEMVKEINKQLKVLEEHDADSIAIERYRGYFKRVSTPNPNYNTIRKLYTQAKEVLESDRLSIESQERSIANSIDTLHRDGYNFINRKNFNSFMRFLDDARARGLGSLYSSEQLLDTINKAKKQGLSDEDIKKNIDRWSNEMSKDTDGKIVEVINPKELKIKKYGNKRK